MNWAKLAEYFYTRGKSVRSLEGWIGEFLFGEGEVWRKRFYAVMEKVADCKAFIILDLMCGGAYPSRHIAKSNGCKFVVGADLDCQALIFAKKKIREEGLRNVELVRSDARSLPFRDDAFDLAFEIGGVEFLEENERWAFLQEARRVTRENLILTFTNEKFRQRLAYRLGLVHLRFILQKKPKIFTSHEIRKFVSQLSKNFEITESGYSTICKVIFSPLREPRGI